MESKCQDETVHAQNDMNPQILYKLQDNFSFDPTHVI